MRRDVQLAIIWNAESQVDITAMEQRESREYLIFGMNTANAGAFVEVNGTRRQQCLSPTRHEMRTSAVTSPTASIHVEQLRISISTKTLLRHAKPGKYGKLFEMSSMLQNSRRCGRRCLRGINLPLYLRNAYLSFPYSIQSLNAMAILKPVFNVA